MDSAPFTGHVILLMAPMGSGKRELETAAKAQYPALKFLVSCTTRLPRPGEVDGIDYHFVTREQFEKRVANGDFLEWAEFGGNLYGTLKSEILTPLQTGQVVLNEIELQGVEQLRALVPPENRTIVYIDAGDWNALRARALKRAPITEQELELRHQRYLVEIQSKPYADVVIDNRDGMLEVAQKAFVELVGSIVTRVG